MNAIQRRQAEACPTRIRNNRVRALRHLQDFTAGKTFEEYSGDLVLRSAVERQFMILGEALVQVLKIDPSVGPSITDRPKIVAFRNILVHGYAIVEDAVVWKILNENLPALIREIDSLLKPIEEPAAGTEET